MTDHRISIIIPAFNEAASIGICIRSIQENDYPASRYEIVVADNGSTDDTIAIARDCGAAVLDCGRANTIAAMRNRGAAATTGHLLLFMDGDVKIPKDFLESAVLQFENDFSGAVGYVDKVPAEAGWVGRVWGEVQALKRPRIMAADNLPGRNLLVNRTVFDRVNGFDETLSTGEDKDFCMRVVRAGFPVRSIPSPSPVHMGCEPDLRTFMKKEFWRQSSALPLARRHGFTPRSLRNPLLGLWHLGWGGLLMISLLFLQPPWLTGVSFFLWILPSAGIALKTVGRQRPLVFLLQYFLLTFIRWNAAGMALVSQMLYRRQRVDRTSVHQ